MKYAIVVLADTESHESLGRIVNALEFAKELKEYDDDIRIVFDGGGVTWPPELSDPEHKANPLYEAVKDKIDGACSFCASAFGVKQKLIKQEIPLLDDYDDHPSLRNLAKEGYQIVTF